MQPKPKAHWDPDMEDHLGTAHVGWFEVVNRTYAGPLVLVCLGVWLHAADGLIVATMMPEIVKAIGGDAYVAWSVLLYELGSIIAGAASAFAVLRWGVRKPMMAAAILFALGCLISAAAPLMAVLLAGRFLQGVGGGGLTALSFIAAAVLFPSRLSARVMAAISVLWGASAFLGPLIGGFFVQQSSWRMGFLFFAAQAIFLAGWILFGIRLPKSPMSNPVRGVLPFGRLLLLLLGVLLIACSGSVVSLPRTPILLLIGGGVLSVFLWLEAQSTETRLLPKQPFNLRSPVGSAMVMNLAMSMATMGLSTYGPLLMIAIHGTTAIAAGYVLAAVALGWTFSAILVSGAPETHDPYYIAGGMVLVFASVGGMIFSVPNGPIGLIAGFAAIEGIGFGAAWTFVIRRARRLANPEDVERLSGALPTVGRFGYALGAAMNGILANAAGFSAGGSAEQARAVARTIFTGSLPVALLGLFAMACFILPGSVSKPR